MPPSGGRSTLRGFRLAVNAGKTGNMSNVEAHIGAELDDDGAGSLRGTGSSHVPMLHVGPRRSRSCLSSGNAARSGSQFSASLDSMISSRSVIRIAARDALRTLALLGGQFIGGSRGIRSRVAERRGHSRRSWAARAVNESLVRRRSSTLRASAASAAARRCGLVSDSSIRRSKPQAPTNRRAVLSMGLAWPASYRVMAERDIPARFESSDRVSPARFRAWRIADPSIVSMAPRYPIACWCRKATSTRKGWVAGASRESADCRRDALGPQRQAKLVAEQLVLRATARVGLAVLEDLPHAFAA